MRKKLNGHFQKSPRYRKPPSTIRGYQTRLMRKRGVKSRGRKASIPGSTAHTQSQGWIENSGNSIILRFILPSTFLFSLLFFLVDPFLQHDLLGPLYNRTFWLNNIDKYVSVVIYSIDKWQYDNITIYNFISISVIHSINMSLYQTHQNGQNMGSHSGKLREFSHIHQPWSMGLSYLVRQLLW